MHETTRRALLAMGAGTVGTALAGCLDGSAEPSEEAAFAAATSYYDPGCDCCDLHADYVDDANADIEIVELSNDALMDLKDEHGIPSDYRSCHTTELGNGYVIEGHVPIDVMNEVVDREPAVEVIALPGMPSGSPGMPGSKDGDWVFYSIDEDGNVDEFTRR